MKIVLVCTNENARRTDKIFFCTKSKFMKSELHKKKETKITKKVYQRKIKNANKRKLFFSRLVAQSR